MMTHDQTTGQSVSNIAVTLLRYEETFAIASNPLIGELRWPIKNLPDGVKIGDTVSLKMTSQNDENSQQFVYMKKLLEELIN